MVLLLVGASQFSMSDQSPLIQCTACARYGGSDASGVLDRALYRRTAEAQYGLGRGDPPAGTMANI